MMARTNDWAPKVLALLKANNPPAAIAQIKAAPSVRDLTQLQGAIASGALAGRWPNVDAAITDTLIALSAPRLHRSP